MEGLYSSPVPDHLFNAFHSIDRELYTRLVLNLHRNPAESVYVMAFWMFLEKETIKLYLVKRMLSLTPKFLNDVAEETATCLTYVFNNEGQQQFEIVLLPEIIGNLAMGFRFFLLNRDAVMEGVNKQIESVCTRAFSDIYQRTLSERVSVTAPPPEVYGPIVPKAPPVRGNVAPFPPPFVHGSGMNIRFDPSPLGNQVVQFPPEQPRSPVVIAAPPPLPPPPQRQVVNNEFNTRIVGPVPPPEVPADDRTIFLTFSKGYPISPQEIREYFTKRFGDFIEALIMQEVGEEEQVLYARMVARSAAVLDNIVGGNKGKYNICGKHVWARKYVKKQHQQQLRSSADSASASASI